jgi:Uma2 family endonuclease
VSKPAKRRASYDDVLAAPTGKVAEVVEGELYVHPRPAGPHAAAATALGAELVPPFGRGRGGPGGWILLAEPELHLGADILVPDLAGWRRTTMDHIPNVAFFEVRPDWVCEVLSPSTEAVDRTGKLAAYAREGVAHAWLVHPLLQTLEVLRLDGDRWAPVATYRDAAAVRAEPFDAIAFPLGALWEDVRL